VPPDQPPALLPFGPDFEQLVFGRNLAGKFELFQLGQHVFQLLVVTPAVLIQLAPQIDKIAGALFKTLQGCGKRQRQLHQRGQIAGPETDPFEFLQTVLFAELDIASALCQQCIDIACLLRQLDGPEEVLRLSRGWNCRKALLRRNSLLFRGPPQLLRQRVFLPERFMPGAKGLHRFFPGKQGAQRLHLTEVQIRPHLLQQTARLGPESYPHAVSFRLVFLALAIFPETLVEIVHPLRLIEKRPVQRDGPALFLKFM